jgi:Spy/CpxP family protein refolding chaperone
MNMITNKKWVLLLLAVLLMVNIGLMLSFYFFGKKPVDGRKIPETPSLYRQLDLTKEQEQLFRKRKESYLKDMKPVWDDIRQSKDSLYKRLSDPSTDDSTINALTTVIAQKTMRSEEILFGHFRELRKLCTPSQQVAFDTLVPQMLSRSGNRNRNRNTQK